MRDLTLSPAHGLLAYRLLNLSREIIKLFSQSRLFVIDDLLHDHDQSMRSVVVSISFFPRTWPMLQQKLLIAAVVVWVRTVLVTHAISFVFRPQLSPTPPAAISIFLSALAPSFHFWSSLRPIKSFSLTILLKLSETKQKKSLIHCFLVS